MTCMFSSQFSCDNHMMLLHLDITMVSLTVRSLVKKTKHLTF